MSLGRPVILIGQPLLKPLLPLLQPHYDALPLWEDEGEEQRGEARAIIWAGEFALPTALLDSMPQLGLIACFTVGYDGVDLQVARQRGIAVTHGGDANAEDVADHAIGLILAHRRWIVEGDRQLRAGLWTPESKTRTRSMGGARLGIVGMGHIGLAVARRAEVMRMRIHWWGPRDKPGLSWPRAESLEAMALESDILLVTARADEDNRGMIDAAVMDALGPEGLLINVARGQLVDEGALKNALRNGRLGGAALDVFQQEPTPAVGWADVPNCVLTPHIGGATDEAVGRMAQMLLANLEAYFAGKPLLSPVTEGPA
ncbi:2-hydroxyacid dehydrogenase [Sphingobium tyrosinilyticum]|jgi:hydroxypyruvate reductase|uniref:2-hydroxyacid dehydrogenase n=1 Tax=Sphingobium tyrosinilyticum TaxID=2715436 RepID=A0ABV9F325_9SPHN